MPTPSVAAPTRPSTITARSSATMPAERFRRQRRHRLPGAHGGRCRQQLRRRCDRGARHAITGDSRDHRQQQWHDHSARTARASTWIGLEHHHHRRQLCGGNDYRSCREWRRCGRRRCRRPGEHRQFRTIKAVGLTSAANGLNRSPRWSVAARSTTKQAA